MPNGAAQVFGIGLFVWSIFGLTIYSHGVNGLVPGDRPLIISCRNIWLWKFKSGYATHGVENDPNLAIPVTVKGDLQCAIVQELMPAEQLECFAFLIPEVAFRF